MLHLAKITKGKGLRLEMPIQMDPISAARLLEKWINFYGMNDKDAWSPEDYPYVKKACQAMQMSIEILRGNAVYDTKGINKAAAVLDEWPTIHCMDDPDSWNPMDFPFVQSALEAIIFTASFLKK